MIKQQIETLQEYTYFDKNCSLHVHFGGFPLTEEYIFNVYRICYGLQNQLACITPKYTFKSSAYKATRKDYCKALPFFTSFDEFYEYMAGIPYFGSLDQPHPNDLIKERKWNINQRYYFVNFINAICYKSHKTIEFRFIRPTYNINKIFFWLYIFNAILLAAELNCFSKSLYDLVYSIYPPDVAEMLAVNIKKCELCSNIQANLNDFIGERTDIEDHIFNTSELL